MHVFRRKDIAALRVTLREGLAPVELEVVHVDLYFFDDLDMVQLNVEVRARNLSLETVRNILFRFGRAYPSGWMRRVRACIAPMWSNGLVWTAAYSPVPTRVIEKSF
jgi:hypothetical protein